MINSERARCLCAVGLLLGGLAACDEEVVEVSPDLPLGDAFVRKQPPDICSCTPPGLSQCPTKYLCLGCNFGSTPVFVCNPALHDCREFCDGCYPADYHLCSPDAPLTLLSLCKYCYEDGGPADKCNKIPANFCAWPDASLPDTGPREAGTKDVGSKDAKPGGS